MTYFLIVNSPFNRKGIARFDNLKGGCKLTKHLEYIYLIIYNNSSAEDDISVIEPRKTYLDKLN